MRIRHLITKASHPSDPKPGCVSSGTHSWVSHETCTSLLLPPMCFLGAVQDCGPALQKSTFSGREHSMRACKSAAPKMAAEISPKTQDVPFFPRALGRYGVVLNRYPLDAD